MNTQALVETYKQIFRENLQRGLPLRIRMRMENQLSRTMEHVRR